ncbi:MAG: TonB-dependent receptor, partial [Leptospiraceae bacterium]|nr:TonB-dependent receptor [Leptospiraceae bacterium]
MGVIALQLSLISWAASDIGAEEEITVKAPQRSMEKDDASGSSSTTIELSDSKQRQESLEQILEKEASIRVQRYGGDGAYSSLSIRGSNPNQVNVYLNGIPLNNAVTGEVNLAELNAQSFDRIEVYRTAADMLTGPAIGGAVNLLLSDRNCTGRLYMRGGSYRTFGAGFFYANAIHGDTDCSDLKKEKPSDVAGSTDGENGNPQPKNKLSTDPQKSWLDTAPVEGDFWYSLGGSGEVSDQNFLFRNENGTPVLNTWDDFDDRRKNAWYR